MAATADRSVLGRLLTTGGTGKAEELPDGSMRAEIHIRPDELVYDPSILIMPHGGDIEIEMVNDDTDTRCAHFPSNGDSRWIWLPVNSKGKVRLNLDGPGYYWYSSTAGNDEGGGLFGAIVVEGDVPEEAKLEGADQPRP